jgi:hypothetical protein
MIKACTKYEETLRQNLIGTEELFARDVIWCFTLTMKFFDEYTVMPFDHFIKEEFVVFHLHLAYHGLEPTNHALVCSAAEELKCRFPSGVCNSDQMQGLQLPDHSLCALA